jgi:hypothetical protein
MKTIFKKLDGIKYFSNVIENGYRLWESNTHPNYKHWSKIK